ncbi:nucleoside hydrolase [Pseudorhodobacter sp. MZDSW-24AT]|uniref:nucleoside hydrolase n=1 Tax=Pseudorhodobacter sp. MZDSW-24AT TaxID=2052957 RepID=UPI001E351669|nr:nucleoside hydrolase [Pseudorhodobacter sp. MZDSW-24AT]
MTHSATTPSLWIDTDLGFDDLAAIGLCLAQGAQVAGLSIVAGNVSLTQAVRNAQSAIALFGWALPIHPGAAAPLKGALQTADYVLGADGMRSANRRLPTGGASVPTGEDAVTAMAAWRRAGGKRVLALGPLTNLAHLAMAAPDLVQGLDVVWMGGAFARGNHTSVAEFNAAVDPEAVDFVLRAGMNLLMVGLECCREVQVTLSDLTPLRAMPGEKAALLADLYEGYIRIAANGTRPMALYDPVAAALALDPGLSQQEAVFIAAELHGTLTRGMTVIEWRRHKAAPNARVATAPQADIIRAQFHAGLIRMAQA